jgi:intracellular sulfur oxidation DsrE/DsrF family protein
MKRYLIWLLVPAVVLPVVWLWYLYTQRTGIDGLAAEFMQSPPETETATEAILPSAEYVADISLHTEEELEVLFDRIEALLERPRAESEDVLVSLVLHGPEVEFFALKNYEKYQSVVDRAAKLNALGAVDISVCRTRMKNLDIGVDEVPAFLRQVPFGPGEVKRLLDSGAVYM